jgi:hypothetical protein
MLWQINRYIYPERESAVETEASACTIQETIQFVVWEKKSVQSGKSDMYFVDVLRANFNVYTHRFDHWDCINKEEFC